MLALQRLSDKPVLAPRGQGFEAAGVFNPAVVKRNGVYTMLYRAQAKDGISSIGYAESADGIHFTRRSHPILSPAADYEAGGGLEDPRLVLIANQYYLTYTGYNRKDAQLCMAASRDLVHWQRRGVILPAYKGTWNVGWTKSGALLDRRIQGKYWMYFMGEDRSRRGQIGIISSTDLMHWSEESDTPVAPIRPGRFDSQVVEPGPPPVLTNRGILLIYNGADDKLIYRSGWLLFDRNNPSRVLERSDSPIFESRLEWERTGQVPNVVFLEGLVRERTRWLFYYGAADKYVGAAEAPIASGLRPEPSRRADAAIEPEPTLRAALGAAPRRPAPTHRRVHPIDGTLASRHILDQERPNAAPRLAQAERPAHTRPRRGPQPQAALRNSMQLQAFVTCFASVSLQDHYKRRAGDFQ